MNNVSDMTDVVDTVVWPEDSERQAWWTSVLGIESGVRECATADFSEQRHEMPLGDDGIYPSTRVQVAAAA